jgi:hypothetical protein
LNTKTAATDTPVAPIEPFDHELYKQAISEGRQILTESGSKAAASRRIFELIHSEPRDIILKAFIEGAEVTPKGAPTYFYNISRKFKRKAKESDSD